MGIWKYLQSSLNSLKLFLGVSRGILRWISMQENAPFHDRKYEIFSNSQFLQEFHQFSLLPLLKLTMTSKCRKSILCVSKNIYWLCLVYWNNFGTLRNHCKLQKCQPWNQWNWRTNWEFEKSHIFNHEKVDFPAFQFISEYRGKPENFHFKAL